MKYFLPIIMTIILSGCSLFQRTEKIKFEIENPKQDLDIKIDVPDNNHIAKQSVNLISYSY